MGGATPTFCLVVHLTGKVGNAKSGIVDVFGLQEGLVVGMDTVQFLHHGDICPLWEAALFVQEGDDAHGLEGQQIQCRPIVCVVNEVPGDVLQAVLLLLHCEHVLHKELLQVLIGEVDAELLEAIVLEIFKTKYVQEANGPSHILGVLGRWSENRVIDLLNNP